MEKKTRVQLMGAAAVVVLAATSVWAQTTTPLTTAILGENGNQDTSTDAGVGDGKGIENVVKVTGSFGDLTAEDTAFENVDVVSASLDVDIIKQALGYNNADGTPKTGVARPGVNDVITYTYTITNNSNVTLDEVVFTDTHRSASGEVNLTIGGCSVVAPATGTVVAGDSSAAQGSAAANQKITGLSVGGVVTCTSTYTVKQEDVDQLQKAVETSGSPAAD